MEFLHDQYLFLKYEFFMHLIKLCPLCGTKLRFPIDKGRIKVKCPCGHSFTADPDDTVLYNNSEFDLTSAGSSAGKSRLGALSQTIKQFKADQIIGIIISGLYNLKYKLQNYKLLSSSERRKLTIILISILVILIMIIFCYFCNSGSKPPEDGIV